MTSSRQKAEKKTDGVLFQYEFIKKDNGKITHREEWLALDQFDEWGPLEIMCKNGGSDKFGNTKWILQVPRFVFTHPTLTDKSGICCMRSDELKKGKNCYKRIKFKDCRLYTQLTGQKEINPKLLETLNKQIVYGQGGFYPWITIKLYAKINNKEVARFLLKEYTMNYSHGDSVIEFINMMKDTRKEYSMILPNMPFPEV